MPDRDPPKRERRQMLPRKRRRQEMSSCRLLQRAGELRTPRTERKPERQVPVSELPPESVSLSGQADPPGWGHLPGQAQPPEQADFPAHVFPPVRVLLRQGRFPQEQRKQEQRKEAVRYASPAARKHFMMQEAEAKAAGTDPEKVPHRAARHSAGFCRCSS